MSSDTKGGAATPSLHPSLRPRRRHGTIMSTQPQHRPETLAIHAGYTPEPSTGARQVPIYNTSSYVFKDTEHAANLFALKDFGNIYSRIMNPTTDALEKRLAALEGGVAGLAVASGQAAETTALLTLLRAGDELIAGSALYGGTYNLLKNTLSRLGIHTNFVDIRDADSFRRAATEKTRAIYVESLPNPELIVPDLAGIAKVAEEIGVPLIVDNTAATPALLRPIEHGAHIVVESLTKYISGQGTGIGGAIIDAGTFKWDNGKFPEFTEANPNYHGLKLYETFGNLSFILKARVETLRDTGAALSPFNAHGFLLGLETLHLRMARHSENALTVAKWLQDRPEVTWVRYPGLPGDPGNASARDYLRGGHGGLVTFGVAGGHDAARKIADGVELFSLLANIGDARSLIIHPASTTHQQLSQEQQLSTGVTPDLIRLSVGLEHTDDLIADLTQALEKATA